MPEEQDQHATDADRSSGMSERSEPLGREPSRIPDWAKFGVLFVALSVLAYVAINPQGPTNADGVNDPAVGRRLMEIDLDPLTSDGEPVRVADLRGKVALINYWGTWCGPCRIEFPHLVDLYEQLRDEEDFLFLSVSCLPGVGDNAGSLEADTSAFVDSHGADFPVYSDLQGSSRWALMRTAEWESFGFPTTLVLDRDNTIRGLWRGYQPDAEAEMERVIRELLGRKD